MKHAGKADTAMILAAGLGTRMRPLTLHTPKPLIRVAGRPLIDYAVENLAAGGVKNIVVNIHHLADQVEQWAARKQAVSIRISDETDCLLETGGGVVKALELLQPGPFFVLNGDSFWRDEGSSSIDRLRAAFDPERMDFLLLLACADRATGFDGPGDFFIGADGRLTRRGMADSAPYIFSGCYISTPAAFAKAPAGAFSTNLLWDRALARGRLYGIVLSGLWLHVGTPAAIALAEKALRE